MRRRASSVARFNCSTSTALSATSKAPALTSSNSKSKTASLSRTRIIAAGRERRGRRQKIARHELFRLPPRFGAVAAKREQLVKDDRVGVEVNGNDLGPLNEGALLIHGAHDEELGSRLFRRALKLIKRGASDLDGAGRQAGIMRR